MALTIRDFNTMVEAILDRIIAANVGFTDKSNGSVLRTIVNAIVAEMDIQYYQMEYIYNGKSLNDSTGDDLDKLVVVLGISRNQATNAQGTVTFSRSTPAQFDISIPKGTIISTRANATGSIVEFTTNADAKILAGTTSVDVIVTAVIPGKLYISSGQVSIMSNPIVGIESVCNNANIDSGTDIETDASLRAHARLALDGLGKGTDNALESAIRQVNTVLDVLVLDRNRGNGTTDISVVCSTMPPPQAIQDEITAKIMSNKASGIDVQVIYPTIKSVDITITTTGLNSIAGNAALAYFGTLGAGDTFIVSQCLGKIITAYNDGTIDVSITLPATNQTATSSEIIRVGIITINGVVWNG